MKVKTKSKKVNKAWLNQHVNDPYVKAAQKDGYRARAAYKLKEIDEQLGLIRPGDTVVDLGCAPGAWSQYLRRRLSPGGAAAGQLNGTIIGLDLLPMEPIEGVAFIQGDFREDSVLAQLQQALQGRLADAVVSDMAPNLSGVDSIDAARIAHLIELAVDFAQHHMKPEGALVVKLFPAPSTSATLSLVVSRLAAAIAIPWNPSTVVETPTAWYDALVDYVEAKALRRDRDPRWQEARQLYVEKRDNLINNPDYLAVNREMLPSPRGGGYMDAWLVEYED